MQRFYPHPLSLCSQRKPNLSLTGEDGPVTMSLEYYNPANQSTWVFDILNPLSTKAIYVQSTPFDVVFYTFQAHSYLQNISLSYNSTLIDHSHVNGTNLGLVWKTKQGAGTFYVTNSNLENVTVMYAIVAYGAYSPVPGGCNMEFEVETAPYLKVGYNNAMIQVDFQPAQYPGASCTSEAVTHDVYHMFMYEREFSEEAYFLAIQDMLIPSGAIANGLLAPVPVYGSVMRRLFSLYAGTGSVYVVVAQTLTGASAYVPAVTYGCSSVYFSDSCTVLSTTFSKVLCACVLFLGLFACFGGHTFFRSQVFLAGFLSGSLLAYVGLTQWTPLPFGSGVTLSCVVGLGVGVLCLLLWYLCGIPVIAILHLVIPLGFLVASIVFYAGLGDFQFAQLDLDFWLTFLVVMLTVVVLMVPLLANASMVSCAVVGAYTAVVPLDHYLGSNLKYIVINTLRRASVPGFSLAVIHPPFQATDGMLVLAWALLAVIGLRSQQIRQTGRPPFPPSSRGPPPLSLPSGLTGRTGTAATVRTPIRVASRIPYRYGSVGDDDVFETPPGQAAQGGSVPRAVMDWFGSGCGLRGR
ncbi:transmembrane 7 superfamily member 3-like isoform X2 [Thrips palmi]|uniref:Transmembrane 7 superfamily member 3-like isoform X2 n=1 Tax=Thrips palmi TaxID=161013 RepID=A0A6P8ZPQ3_THRPL|nr:transmembrane 7 superfamily member 3-like isoform X2 [Thrips palmi]